MAHRKAHFENETKLTSPGGGYISVDVGKAAREGEIQFGLSLAGTSHEIFFRSKQVHLYRGVEPITVLALLPAMRLGLNVWPTQPVSADFIANLHGFMEIFSSWFPDFKKIEFLGKQALHEGSDTAERIGTFFTGGVDSFYTLLKHRSEITDLVYVHGFDISLDDWARRKAVSDMGEAVAHAFGKRFVEVETNARRLLKGHTKWGKHAHGAALACTAHVVSPEFKKIYIPSSFHHGALFPWGSHPDTDPLLSGPWISIVHDGCEVKRTEKIELICHSQAVMDHLRVCYHNVEGTYNCGKCEKCLRTMITLYALGELERCRTLPDVVDPVVLKNLLFTSLSEQRFVEENLALMDARGLRQSPVYMALQKAAARSPWLTRLLVFYRRQLRN